MNNQLITNKQFNYTPDQVELIRTQIAPKATNDELKLFLYQCQRTGLDALSRQIYAIHRKQNVGGNYVEKMTIQTSIDGFRVIAERSGEYAGQDEPVFEGEGNTLKCKVTVYKFKGVTRYPAAVGVAYWSEYVQTDYKTGNPTGLWAKMPHTMLAKVAEALALRKAFPQDLSGLYTTEEMHQADKNQEPDFTDIPDKEELDVLRQMVGNSTLSETQKVMAYESIDTCKDFKKYDQIKYRLEDVQHTVDTVINPSAKDISQHIKKLVS